MHKIILSKDILILHQNVEGGKRQFYKQVEFGEQQQIKLHVQLTFKGFIIFFPSSKIQVVHLIIIIVSIRSEESRY